MPHCCFCTCKKKEFLKASAIKVGFVVGTKECYNNKKGFVFKQESRAVMKKFQKFIFSRRVVGVFLTVCLCAPFAVCAQALSLPQDRPMRFSAALALEALALCQGITAQDASQAVQEQGFTVLAQQHFDKAEDDPSHTCAFTLATAQLTYQQEPRTLLLIAIRGTSAGEWYANFDFEPSESSGGSFAGNFLFAAQDAFLSVQQALSQMENPLVLVCGYSRGAACANLLGLMLNAICPQENVFVYTFATPATVCGDASASCRRRTSLTW